MDQKRKFSYYNISTWPERGINYWGIPKCGNTSIKYALRGCRPDRYEEHDQAEWVHHKDQAEYITPDEALSNGRTNITVVRHPYDRVMSLYRDFVLRRPKNHSKGARTLENFIYNVIIESDDTIDTNLHYRSISYFIANTNRTSLLVDKVFDISNIDYVYQKYGLDNIVLNKSPVYTEDALSTVHKKLIFNRYRDDFRLLGYSEL